MATGLLSVVSALLGYTAIALESRCLLASVEYDEDVMMIMRMMMLGYTAIALESRCLLASVENDGDDDNHPK